MVEKKEFAVIFKKENRQNGVEEFIPMDVVEGVFDQNSKRFIEKDFGIRHIHIKDVIDKEPGYACRTTIELMKDSISEEGIEQIKDEILFYASQYMYVRNKNINDHIITTNSETGDEFLFEDKDIMPNIEIKSELPNQQVNKDGINLTPQELEERIKKTIKGQDEAVRKIVTALWTTLKFRHLRKKNMLIVGPSGVGKTAIFEKIKDILNLPVVIFSVPGLSQAGYVGRGTDEILKQIYYDTGCDEDEAANAIVILDEIDKIASSGDAEVATTGVQNELLKIIEGCDRYVAGDNPGEAGFSIDTSQMIFIGTGAFQELYEKENTSSIGFLTQNKESQKQTIDTDRLIKYGLKRELVGRLPILVELNSLGKKELKEIVTSSDESELNSYIRALADLDVKVENIDEVIDYIAEDALKRKIGARGLVLTINNLFEEIFYEIGNNPGMYSKVIIGPNIINDNKDFKLIKRRTNAKKRVKNN